VINYQGSGLACVCVFNSIALYVYIPVATRRKRNRFTLPGFEYVAHVFIFSRSALIGAPDKI
jgi:hypothetical protein